LGTRDKRRNGAAGVQGRIVGPSRVTSRTSSCGQSGRESWIEGVKRALRGRWHKHTAVVSGQKKVHIHSWEEWGRGSFAKGK